MTIQNKLFQLNACKSAQIWAEGKSWEEIYNTCHRGDWMCWLFVRTNPDDLQILTLVKGHQANTVRHLMKDKRSLKAVDAAIAFGEGKIDLRKLNAAFKSAWAAAGAATFVAYAAYAAAYAALVSERTADDAASTAHKADAAAYEETANIFRKYIPIELFKINL